MCKPVSIYARLAQKAIAYALENGHNAVLPVPPDIDPSLQRKACCFVSLHTESGDLRGCIGSLEARRPDLFHEIVHNALSAAFNDYRFEPVTKKEFDKLEIGVDVLSEHEYITDISQLDPSVYGIIVTDGNSRKAVLLPDLPEITTVKKQIEVVKKKAGLESRPDSSLHFYRFTSERYH
jgi:hypothetical protein